MLYFLLFVAPYVLLAATGLEKTAYGLWPLNLKDKVADVVICLHLLLLSLIWSLKSLLFAILALRVRLDQLLGQIGEGGSVSKLDSEARVFKILQG